LPAPFFHNFACGICAVWGFVGGECAYCSSVQKEGPTCAGHLVQSSLLLAPTLHCHLVVRLRL
jgi:acyl-CoA synthetase (AMP-forming)/AMP-acid ligase II